MSQTLKMRQTERKKEKRLYNISPEHIGIQENKKCSNIKQNSAQYGVISVLCSESFQWQEYNNLRKKCSQKFQKRNDNEEIIKPQNLFTNNTIF